ncbi:CHAT domain-containing protein [Lentzea sp. NPDC003310]|uniref:CHAT domain-containing tetratricopeptide repeat protein n=1 Tax=Lentzea sp. NPDC003310 TaxID=3154447 RepID=UPI0033A7BD1D
MFEDPVVAEAERLLDHARYTHDFAALDRARDLLDREIAAMAPGDRYRSERLSTLGMVLRELSGCTGRKDVLDQAVHVLTQAAECPGAPLGAVVVARTNLGNVLLDRYDAARNATDLDAAEDTYRRALGLFPDCQLALAGLAMTVKARYDLTGLESYVDEEVALCRLAVAAPAAEPADLANVLGTLSSALVLQHQLQGGLPLLEEAVRTAAAAARCDQGSLENRAASCTNWGTALVELYSETADETVLAEAEQAFRKSLALLPERHRLRPGALVGLSNVVGHRFGRSGDLADLDSAIALATEALGLVAPGSVDHGGCLHALGIVLYQRYEITGAPATLDAVIDVLARGADALPDTDSFKPAVLTALGGHLVARADVRFEQQRAEDDRREGLQHLRAALAAAPGRGSLRPILVSNLATGLLDVHDEEQDPALLDEAERIAGAELATLGPQGRGHDLLVNVLATAALRRVEAGAPLSVLDLTEHRVRALLAATPRNDRAKAVFRHKLAEILSHRLGATPDDAALAAELRELWQAIAATTVTAPGVRISRYADLGRSDAAARRWESATGHYRAAIELIAELAPATWRRSDRLSKLPSVFALASEAAACALRAGRPELAVELLEQGRAVLVEHPHLDREALSRLRRANPGLASEYAAVVHELGRFGVPDAGALAPALDAEHRLRVQRRHTAVVGRIRALGGDFARFLLPPACGELVSLLGDRQVVVLNVARAGSDAVLVGRGTVRVVPLPALTFEAVLRQTALFLDCLETDDQRAAHAVLTWLWRTAVQPVLTELGLPLPDGRLDRIWWCPTGFLHSLPLHAAGWYHAAPGRWTGRRVPGESTMDQVVSSYTPTIRMLVDALATPAPPAGDPAVLAVGLSVTESGGGLADARAEALAVAEAVGAGTVLLDEEAHHARLCREIGRHRWVHFAGHGKLDEDRADSALLMPFDDVSTGPLTSLQIAGLARGTGELAYLSACDSGRGRLDLADEPIHVAGAFQQAGFRSVVSTRWPVPDSPAREVATRFYRALVADPRRDCAAALHHAMCAVRNGRRGSDLERPVFSWAAFIHSGPQEGHR